MIRKYKSIVENIDEINAGIKLESVTNFVKDQRNLLQKKIIKDEDIKHLYQNFNQVKKIISEYEEYVESPNNSDFLLSTNKRKNLKKLENYLLLMEEAAKEKPKFLLVLEYIKLNKDITNNNITLKQLIADKASKEKISKYIDKNANNIKKILAIKEWDYVPGNVRNEVRKNLYNFYNTCLSWQKNNEYLIKKHPKIVSFIEGRVIPNYFQHRLLAQTGAILDSVWELGVLRGELEMTEHLKDSDISKIIFNPQNVEKCLKDLENISKLVLTYHKGSECNMMPQKLELTRQYLYLEIALNKKIAEASRQKNKAIKKGGNKFTIKRLDNLVTSYKNCLQKMYSKKKSLRINEEVINELSNIQRVGAACKKLLDSELNLDKHIVTDLIELYNYSKSSYNPDFWGNLYPINRRSINEIDGIDDFKHRAGILLHKILRKNKILDISLFKDTKNSKQSLNYFEHNIELNSIQSMENIANRIHNQTLKNKSLSKFLKSFKEKYNIQDKLVSFSVNQTVREGFGRQNIIYKIHNQQENEIIKDLGAKRDLEFLKKFIKNIEDYVAKTSYLNYNTDSNNQVDVVDLKTKIKKIDKLHQYISMYLEYFQKKSFKGKEKFISRQDLRLIKQIINENKNKLHEIYMKSKQVQSRQEKPKKKGLLTQFHQSYKKITKRKEAKMKLYRSSKNKLK